MADQSVMNEPAEPLAKQAMTADVVVGLLTLNNIETIEQAVKSIIEGLRYLCRRLGDDSESS